MTASSDNNGWHSAWALVHGTEWSGFKFSYTPFSSLSFFLSIYGSLYLQRNRAHPTHK